MARSPGSLPKQWPLRLIGVLLGVFAGCGISNAQIPSPLQIDQVVADPVRPRVYGLHQSGANAGSVVVFDLVTRTVTHGIPVGNFPTDFAIRPDGSELYVLNSGSKTISKINLTTLTVVKTTALSQFGTWETDITVTPGNLGLGPGDVVYYTDGAWGPALHAIHFETGQHLQTTQFTGPTDTDGFGDFLVSPDGTRLFGWKQYGWSAGNLGTMVARYGVSGSGLLTFESAGSSEFSGSWNRDPLDTPVLMDASGDSLIIKNRVVNPSNPREFRRSFPEPIYSIASGGRVAGAVGNLYDAATTDSVSAQPDLGKVQCFSRDGALLVYFKASSASFAVLDLVDLLGIDALGLSVSPAPYSVGRSPSAFSWFARDGATTYRVFLGSSEAAVAAAGAGSSLIIGETSNPSLSFPTTLAAGSYFWRVDAITPQGILKGDVLPFSVSAITLSAGKADFGPVVGVQTVPVSIQMSKSGAGEVAWSAVCNQSWLTLAESSGTTPSTLQIQANISGLGVGLHQGSVTVQVNGVSFQVPVSIRVEALNYTHLKADELLPYVYGISQVSASATTPAYLLKIDASTGQVLKSVEVGSSVSDLEIHYPENRIYLTNWMTGKLRALDRTTLDEVQAYPFTPFAGVGYSQGDAYAISAGKAGQLMVEENDQWVDLSLMNTTTGAVLDTQFARQGNGVFDPTGRYYYHGDDNISNAALRRYDTNGNNIVELGSVQTSGVSYYGSRIIERSGDGTRYYWNGTAHDTQLNVLWTINEEIVGASLHGDVVFTSGEIRNGSTGAVLSTLPVSTPIMAITGNQRNLFLASGGSLTKVDLSQIINLPGAGVQPLLVDGSTIIGVNQKLGWTLDPFASGYRVYFGTSLAAVQAADETSPLYLGTVTGGEISLPSELTLGNRYFWRVDPVGFLGAMKGPVWSFEVAPVDIVPAKLAVSIPFGLKTVKELQLSAPTAQGWTASVATPGPLSLDQTTGTTPGTVRVTVDAAGLAAGSHSRTITFVSGGKTFEMPVAIEVLSLNYTHLEADQALPHVYAISQVSESSTSPAHLLRIDGVSGQILDSVPVGASVSDLEIHYPENRIYVTNWMTGKLRALDRSTLQEVQVYNFTPFGGPGVGGDVYRISAGKAGRLIVEEKDQWIDLGLLNTSTGSVIASSLQREGGGISDPSGRYYYHGDNNSSGAQFHRFDTNSDTFLKLASVRTTGVSTFGGRTVKSSADGSRFYWNGTAHDAQLNVLWTNNEEIQAATLHGEAVFTQGKVRNGSTGAVIATLPVSTSIIAISGHPGNVFLASGGTLTKVALSSLIGLPGGGIVPAIANGSTVIGRGQTLKWSLDPNATSYKVYLGTSLAAVQSAGETSAEFLGTVTNGQFVLPQDLILGGRYFWRVDSVGLLGSVTGTVWSFDVAPLEISPTTLSVPVPAGLQVTQRLTISAPTPTSWTASVPPAGPLSLNLTAGSTPATLQVTVNAQGMAVGSQSSSVTFTSGGKTFSIPVAIEVQNLNYTHLEADQALPHVYAISQVSESSTSPAHLLRIDAATGQILKTVEVGSSVSDVEIHYPENRIYVTNWMTGKLRAFDRSTLEEVRVYPFTPFSGTAVVGDVYRISAGKAGRLIVEEKDQWIDVRLLNTSTGSMIASSSQREGGGTSDPSGRYYYHGDNNSSGAQFHRFDTNSDSFLKLASVRTTGVSTYGSRTVKRTADGTRYYWNGTAHDAQLNVLWTINEEIVEASLHGDVVFTPGKVRNGATGAVLAALPVTTPIMAIDGQQDHLLMASGGNLTVIELSSILQLPGAGIQPTLADGSIVIGVEQQLGWSLTPFASAYQVYFGTSQSAVQSANDSSAEFLGTVSGGQMALPSNLTLGGRYFWRVDAAGFLGTTKGQVWSFEVAPIEINPAKLTIQIPSGRATTRDLALSGPAGMAWTASVPAPGPLALNKTSGTVPGTLQVTVNAQGLAVGSHARSITVNAGGKTFAIPVAIEVFNVNYTHLEADKELPHVYGISQVSESSTNPAFLFRIDAATGQILKTAAVGASVSDVEIHYPENRIYVTNWMTGKLRAFDRSTLQEVQVYSFTPFGGPGVGGDVYRISAGKAGRLIVEEKDQWIDVSLLDTVSGLILRQVSTREGGGAMDPSGRFYYHGDNNSSDASLRRFDTNGDQFSLIHSVRTTGYSFYGDRNVLVSHDGSRVFWNGSAHDAQLNVLWTGNRRIHAATANGRVAFVPGKVLNGSTGEELAKLSSSATLMAVSSDQKRLFLASGPTLTLIGIDTLVLPPANQPTPTITDGSTLVGGDQSLQWSDVPRAETYRIYLGLSQAAVAAADESSPEYLGETGLNSHEIAGLIESGRSYFWRVDAVGILETIKGDVWSFDVDAISMQPDVTIALNPLAPVGNNTYSATGANQSLPLNLKGNRSGTLHFSVENDGNVLNPLSVTSTRGNRNLDVTYLRTFPSPANITATLTLPGGLKLSNQDPGSKTGVQAAVRKARSSKARRSSLTLLFRAVADGDGSTDAVQGMIRQSD